MPSWGESKQSECLSAKSHDVMGAYWRGGLDKEGLNRVFWRILYKKYCKTIDAISALLRNCRKIRRRLERKGLSRVTNIF